MIVLLLTDLEDRALIELFVEAGGDTYVNPPDWRKHLDGYDLIIADNPVDLFKVQAAIGDSSTPILFHDTKVRSVLEREMRGASPILTSLILSMVRGEEMNVPITSEPAKKKRWFRRG